MDLNIRASEAIIFKISIERLFSEIKCAEEIRNVPSFIVEHFNMNVNMHAIPKIFISFH